MKKFFFFFVFFHLSNLLSAQDNRMIFKGVPIVNITLSDGKIESQIDRETKLNATVVMTNASGSSFTSSQLFSGNITIKGRGNLTWNYSKHPYNIVTCDASFKKKNVPLFGMPSGSGWTLLAEFEDRTAVKNLFTSTLSYVLGLPWSSRGLKVELYINGDYRGLYTLCEKVERDVNRINIKDIKTTDISGDAMTGGYTIERQFDFQLKPGEVWFRDVYGGVWSYKVPDSDQVAPEQNIYLRDLINVFFNKVDSRNFSDTINGYRSLINPLSFAQYYLLQDISKNGDVYNASWYITKDRLKKMDAGPGWDWGFAWGGIKLYNLSEPNDSIFMISRGSYYTKMMEDTFFSNLVCRTFASAAPKFTQLITDVELYYTKLLATGAITRDANRWNFDLNYDFWNYYPTQQGHADAFFSFVKQRFYYLQRNVYKVPVNKPTHSDLP